jgi:hypothetical protein
MRRFSGVIVVLVALFSTAVWAAADGPGALLNRVSLRLNAEQWLMSKTSMVTVGISASVNDAALDKIQDDVIKKLNQLAKGDWHITTFDRSQDQSGLESVRMQAQARLAGSALPGFRDRAKALSKPGETYTLDNIQFTPSEDEVRDANTALRANIYAQAKDELDRVNKMYPDQKYYIHEVNFISDLVPVPMPQNVMSMAVRAGNGGGNLAVGDKLVLNATVVLASIPDQGIIKVLH